MLLLVYCNAINNDSLISEYHIQFVLQVINLFHYIVHFLTFVITSAVQYEMILYWK